jgi:hypothetical protein
MSSIQFKIGFHYQDCLHTLFIYFNRRPDAFDIGTIDPHGVRSLLSARHTTGTGKASGHQIEVPVTIRNPDKPAGPTIGLAS